MSNSGSNSRPRRRLAGPLDDRGVAAAEFAVIGGLFFLIVFAVLDVGRYFLVMHSLRTVAAQAGRAAMINPGLDPSADGAAACTTPAIVNAAGGLGFLGPDASLCINRTVPSRGVTQIAVTVQSPYQFMVPVFGTRSLTLSESQSFRFGS